VLQLRARDQFFCTRVCRFTRLQHIGESMIGKFNVRPLKPMLQGVSLSYLAWLRAALSPSLSRISTSQFCQMYVRPFTWRNRCSVTQQLMARDEGAQHVGAANWFISHTWSNAFADTLDAILLFFAEKPGAYLWLDVLATSQHSVLGQSKPSSSWMRTFKDCIARIGGVLLVVDAWDNPTALRRAW
jgi:hypothetical protein